MRNDTWRLVKVPGGRDYFEWYDPKTGDVSARTQVAVYRAKMGKADPGAPDPSRKGGKADMPVAGATAPAQRVSAATAKPSVAPALCSPAGSVAGKPPAARTYADLAREMSGPDGAYRMRSAHDGR